MLEGTIVSKGDSRSVETMDRGRHYRHLDGTKDSSATLYSSMPNTLRTDDMDTAQVLSQRESNSCGYYVPIVPRT